MVDSLNPGQKRLLKDYAAPAADEYWGDEANPPTIRHFQRRMYAQHPAMKQAVGGVIDMVYSQALRAYTDAVQEAVDEAVAAATERLQGLAKKVAEKQGEDQKWGGTWAQFEVPDSIAKDPHYGTAKNYFLAGIVGHNIGAPWWYLAQDAFMFIPPKGYDGQRLTPSQVTEEVKHLMAATASDPRNSHMPAGYTPLYADPSQFTGRAAQYFNGW